MEKVTVVVPCFNVEEYLARCLNSILEQTYQNIEIICIEDYSTDNTKKILKKYEKNPKIRTIYNNFNKGLGSSRNIGIRECKTRLITFVDSDDYLPKNFIYELYNTLRATKADAAVCDVFVRFENAAPNQQSFRSRPFMRKPTKYGFINYYMAAASWNKLYKTELFNNNLFPEKLFSEDIPVVLPILLKSKVVYVPNTFYNYVQRSNSIQNSDVSEKRLDVAKAVKLFIQRVGSSKQNQKYIDLVVFHQWIVILLFVIPKQRNFKKRTALIKKYAKISKDFKISKNPIYREYIAALSGAERMFTESFVGGTRWHLFSLVSWLMLVNNWRDKNKDRGIARVLFAPWLLPRIVIDRLLVFRNVIKKNITISDLVKQAKLQSKKKSEITVSAVIPNYNYADFMLERIYSILYQTEKVSEIIILDDVSTDNSIEVLKGVVQKLSPYIDIKLVANQKNNGTFRQWYKGFKLAKGEYIWICEADDYCDKRLLAQNLKPIKQDKSVILSYSQTAVIDRNGRIKEPDLKYAIDIRGVGHWDNDFIIDGKQELSKYAFLNNEIANVSAALIKKTNQWAKYFVGAFTMKQAGDWQIYNNIMLNGKIAFSAMPLNYYRMHGDNVSSITKKQLHFEEIKQIHKTLSNYWGG